MSDPLPAAPALARAPSGESLLAAVERRGGGQPTLATVLALTRQGPLIEGAGNRWLVGGAPLLPQGAKLTLDHVATGAPPQPARLLSIDGQALAPPVAIRLQPVGSPPVEPPPAGGGPRAVEVKARLIDPAGRPLGPVVTIGLSAAAGAPGPSTASRLPPAAGGLPAGPSGPTLAPPAAGGTGQPRAAAVAPSATSRQAAPALAVPPASWSAAAPASAAPGLAAPPASLSAVTPAPAAPVVPALPSTTAAPPPLPAAPTQPAWFSARAALPAEVVDRDARGRLLVQSGELRLRLETPLDLPPGARLALVLPQGLPPAAGDLPAPAADPLQRLIAALLQQERTGSAAHETGALRLPAADHALAARLLRWIQTLGAASSTLTDESAAAHEPQTAGETLRAATLELARQTRELQPGGWRVLVMPIGVEDPQILRVHLRESTADSERGAQPGGDRADALQRAIFEVELSHLGRCQLDVLCQRERFDLVVRSAARLGPAVEDEIRSLIAATRAAAGLAGRLEFRAAELLTLPDPLQPAGQQITV